VALPGTFFGAISDTLWDLANHPKWSEW
jgi:hypothetical protein